MLEFNEFPKIARLNREVIVTEKIDGTNAQVHIRHAVDEFEPGYDVQAEINGGAVYMRAGSRTRWLRADDDNFGFWAWFYANAHELVKLGVGAHFGEWWGKGIQRGYGLTEKRFSLFNTYRWSDDAVRPACCSVVPVLARGEAHESFSVVARCMNELRAIGSKAAPGFMKPEGIVAFHTQGNLMFKATLEKDEEWKGKSKAA
jgi:hypothetical protein